MASVTAEPRLLRPALFLSDRLRTSARLITVVVLLLVPGLLAGGSFAVVTTGQVDFARSELAGVDVLRPALTALSAAVAGETPDVGALRRASAVHPELGVDQDIEVAGRATDRLARVTALAAVVNTVGNTSKLILDPDLDSFYLMDIQVVQIPRLLVSGATSAATLTGAEAEQISSLAVQAGQISGAAQSIATDLDTARSSTSHPALFTGLEPVAELTSTATALSGGIATGLDNPRPADPRDLAAAAGSAVDPLADVLTAILQARAKRLEVQRDATLAVTLAGLLLAAWFACATVWRTRADVRATVTAVTAIAAGELEPKPLPAGRDELGDIGRALDRARSQLADQRDQLQRSNAERESRLTESFERQRAAEQEVRNRAQAIIDETAKAVVTELSSLIDQVDVVRSTASTVGDRVGVTKTLTADVVRQSAAADQGAAALGESLRRVGGLTKLISSVADQTKLLALNATIEAARAGAAGAGFSVVAGEVKALAMESARSSDDITATLSDLETDAGGVATAIATVGGHISSLDEAGSQLGAVAAEQHEVVERLTAMVTATIARVQEMATLTERLERRGLDRVTLSGTVEIDAGRTVTADLVDISPTGLRCATREPLNLKQGQSARLVVRTEKGTLTTAARVAWANVRSDSTDAGFAYDDLTGPARDALNRMAGSRVA